MQVLLETERLILRRLTEADADHLFDLDNDPEVMRFINGGEPTPREVIENDLMPGFLRYDNRSPGFGVWAIIEKASGDFLGWISLRPQKGVSGEATLGYRLRTAAWGQGYATEGARGLIRKGFTDLGLQRVIATTYEDNLASRRVMEKLNMTFVRRFRLAEEEPVDVATHYDPSGDFWDGDDVEYALEKADWEQRE